MKKSYTPIVKLASSKGKDILSIPAHLKPMQFSRYPSDNAVTFERWYMENWSLKDDLERIYLPIQWTALYCNNGYGSATILHTIQRYIDSLDATKKYYTIVQYDDGILNDVSRLDIKVIACSVKSDFSIPLLCTPHKFNFTPGAFKKDIYATFIGNLTHPLRANLVKQLEGKEDYYISTKQHDLREYCKIFARSKYVLCPRGYGLSSFRIQEAIDMQAIPVYISDEFIFPYNTKEFDFGMAIPHDMDIECALAMADGSGSDELWKEYAIKNKQLLTYPGCKQEILKYLSNENTNTEGGNAGI